MNLEVVRFDRQLYYDPVGLWGLAYWYGIYPLHQLVFAGMLKGIVEAGKKDSCSKKTQYLTLNDAPVFPLKCELPAYIPHQHHQQNGCADLYDPEHNKT